MLLHDYLEPNYQRYVFDVAEETSVNIELYGVLESNDTDVVATAAFVFTTREEVVCLPSSEYEIDAQMGSLMPINLGPASRPIRTTVPLSVPQDAATLCVHLLPVPQKQRVLVRPPILKRTSERENIAAYRVGRGNIVDYLYEQISFAENITVFYSNGDCDGDILRRNRSANLAKELANLGQYVIFFSATGNCLDLPENNYPILQLPNQYVADFLTAASPLVGKKNIFICCSSPDILAFTAIDRLKSKSWSVFYDVHCDLEEIYRLQPSSIYHPYLEREISEKADQVSVVSPGLQRKFQGLGIRKKSILVLSCALSDTLIQQVNDHRSYKIKRRSTSNDCVGIIINSRTVQIDWTLLIQVANKNPKIKFEIVSNAMQKHMELPSNIIVLGALTHEELIRRSGDWKVGALPIKIESRLSTSIDSSAIYEYLGLGLLLIVPQAVSALGASDGVLSYTNEIEFSQLLCKWIFHEKSQPLIKTPPTVKDIPTWEMQAKKLINCVEN